MNKQLGLPLIGILFFLSSCFSYLWAKFDPQIKWKTYTSSHFYIHYPTDKEYLIPTIYQIAEKYYSLYTKKFNWKPLLKIHLVITDNSDSANGLANPFPYNKVQIFLTEPAINSSLADYTNWYDQLIAHELTHIFNLDKVKGFPQSVRYIFGRMWFPNTLQPAWQLEGIAVEEESINKHGRNFSDYADMILRTDFITGKEKPIAYASHFNRYWPFGEVHYLYGGKFIQYLNTTYGKNSFLKIHEANSDNLPFFYLDVESKRIYKKTFPQLWKDWQDKARKEYLKQVNRLNKEKITKPIFITDGTGYYLTPRFSQDGYRIYYHHTNNKSDSAIYSIQWNKFINNNIHTTKANQKPKPTKKIQKQVKLIKKTNFTENLAIDKNNNIFFSQPERFRNYSFYNDIFKINGKNLHKKNTLPLKKQLTKGLRVRYMDISSSSNLLIFISQKNNLYSLGIANKAMKNIQYLIKNSPFLMSFCRLSYDNKKIIFSFRHKNAQVDLAIIDIASKKITQLTNDTSHEIQAIFTKDNQKIIYSSNPNKIYNLYEYNLNSYSSVRITNTITGIFTPDLSKNEKWIVASIYTNKGFNLGVVPYKNNEYVKTLKKHNPKVLNLKFFEVQKSTNPVNLKSKKYNPFPSLWPYFWLPTFNFNLTSIYPREVHFTYGLYTFGNDALDRHQYNLGLTHYALFNRLGLDIRYRYSGLWPDLFFAYQSNYIFVGKDLFTTKAPRGNLATRFLFHLLNFSVSLPFLYFKSRHTLSLDYSYSWNQVDQYSTSNGFTQFKYRLSRIRLNYNFSNTKSYNLSISPEEGRQFSVQTSVVHQALGATERLYSIYLSYAEYLPFFFKNHVFLLQLNGGTTFDLSNTLLNPFSLSRLTAPKIRGYANATGKHALSLTLEYRLPLWHIEWGYGNLPIFFRSLYLYVFFDYGNVWLTNNIPIATFKKSVGGELYFSFTLGYYVDVSFFVGYAYGFDALGTHDIYWGFQAPLIEGFLLDEVTH